MFTSRRGLSPVGYMLKNASGVNLSGMRLKGSSFSWFPRIAGYIWLPVTVICRSRLYTLLLRSSQSIPQSVYSKFVSNGRPSETQHQCTLPISVCGIRASSAACSSSGCLLWVGLWSLLAEECNANIFMPNMDLCRTRSGR